jgi:hypothetical protein
VQILNDTDTAWTSPGQVGSGNTLHYNRCSLNTAATSISGLGTILTLIVPVTFQPVFAGTQTLSIQLTAMNGLYLQAPAWRSLWQAYQDWSGPLF